MGNPNEKVKEREERKRREARLHIGREQELTLVSVLFWSLSSVLDTLSSFLPRVYIFVAFGV